MLTVVVIQLALVQIRNHTLHLRYSTLPPLGPMLDLGDLSHVVSSSAAVVITIAIVLRYK